MNLKKIMIGILAGCMLFAFSGCGNLSETLSSTASTISRAVATGGKEHGKEYTAKDNEVLVNDFFAYNINSAEVVSTLEDFLPDTKDNAYLVVDVTVKYAFEDGTSIPMSPADFEIGYASAEETIFPQANFGITDQLPDEWTQMRGMEKTGKIVYLVPKDVTEFQLIYNEIFYMEDNSDESFDGNKYSITFTPDRTNYVELTEEEIAQIG